MTDLPPDPVVEPRPDDAAPPEAASSAWFSPWQLAALVLAIVLTVVFLFSLKGDDDVLAGLQQPDENDGLTIRDPVVEEPTDAAVGTPVPTPGFEDLPQTTFAALVGGLSGGDLLTEPVGCPVIDERNPRDDVAVASSPALSFVCKETNAVASAAAPGRIVMAVSREPVLAADLDVLRTSGDSPWLRALEWGTFVVVDHGATGQHTSLMTIYAGLSEVAPDLRLGQPVATGTVLGTLGPRTVAGSDLASVLQFEIITTDFTFGNRPISQPLTADRPSPEAMVEALAPFVTPPSDCAFPRGDFGNLPGAARAYRNGTHQGVDFNCFSTDRLATASMNGRVLFTVTDYGDAANQDREALLSNAAAAGITPFWTLAFLYGNFVVIDHGQVPGAGHTVTIYAHLDNVDPAMTAGALVDAGQLIGEIGNTGTSTSALGATTPTDPSLHLHWEIHVDDSYVGAGLTQDAINPLYDAMVCGPIITADPLC